MDYSFQGLIRIGISEHPVYTLSFWQPPVGGIAISPERQLSTPVRRVASCIRMILCIIRATFRFKPEDHYASSGSCANQVRPVTLTRNYTMLRRRLRAGRIW